METPNRTKKIVGASAAAIGLMLGAAGVASAVSGPSTTPARSAPATDGSAESPENEANEADESPEQEAAEEAAEQEVLNSFPVSPAQASATALAAVPGTVDEVEMSDNAASPMFEVEIVDANGQEIVVTVDPSSGAVVDQMVEGPESEADEGDEVDEGPESEADEGDETPDATEGPTN